MCVKRNLFAMILHYIVQAFLGMLCSLKINISFLYHLCPLLLLWSSPPLSSGTQIFLKSVLALNQVWCIQDDPTHNLFQWLTRYLILTCTGISQLQHLQSLWYVALLECLYLRIGMGFLLTILFQLLLRHCPILIFLHVTHMLSSMTVGDELCKKKLPL